MIEHIDADILHIGYPKAASTFVIRFLEAHPEVTVDQFNLSYLLDSAAESSPVVAKPCPNKVHISKDENVAKSICIVGELKNWQRNLYVPGGWDLVKDDVVVDPGEAARRMYKVHPHAKVLLLIREQADWLQSVYKYVMSQLPWNRRSFDDYCSTPSGVVLLRAGHFDQTIGAYIDVFGSRRVGVLRFEDIVAAPKRFAAELCAFIGVSELPLPDRRENESHAQIARIQRAFPIIEGVPRTVKSALKPLAASLLPGGRRAILSYRDIRILRGIYAVSNQRTERLLVSWQSQPVDALFCAEVPLDPSGTMT